MGRSKVEEDKIEALEEAVELLQDRHTVNLKEISKRDRQISAMKIGRIIGYTVSFTAGAGIVYVLTRNLR